MKSIQFVASFFIIKRDINEFSLKFSFWCIKIFITPVDEKTFFHLILANIHIWHLTTRQFTIIGTACQCYDCTFATCVYVCVCVWVCVCLHKRTREQQIFYASQEMTLVNLFLKLPNCCMQMHTYIYERHIVGMQHNSLNYVVACGATSNESIHET